MSSKIDTKDKRQITKDWLSFFPEFKEYKPMWIIRRNGPFLCGIYLQRYSSNEYYDPVFHIHNLMVDSDSLSLDSDTFSLTERGVRDTTTLDKHRADLVNISHRLKMQINLLQSASVNINAFIYYIKNVVVNYNGYPFFSLRDIVLALFWCGKIEEAEKEIATGKRIISQWSERVKQGLGGENGWEQQVRQLMNMDTLRATVENQLQKFKLEKFIDYQLIC